MRQAEDEELNMGKTYSWDRTASEVVTKEVFDALGAVEDLTVLEDVKVVLETGGLTGIFDFMRKDDYGEIKAGNSVWTILFGNGDVGAILKSVRFTVPDPKPEPPRGIELAQKLRTAVEVGRATLYIADRAERLPDSWSEHVAVIPKLTKEELLALEAEPEGYRVVWLDGDDGYLRSQSSVVWAESLISEYGFGGAFLLPKVS